MWRNKLKKGESVIQALLDKETFILFDTETMGLADDAKIIQFAGIKYRLRDDLTFEEVESKNIFIDPEEAVPEKITSITGITDEVLQAMPNEGLAAPEIIDWLGSVDFWGAYNALFDYKKIIGMCRRTGTPFVKKQVMDILPMARDVFLGIADDFTLSSVTLAAFPDKTLRFHDALDDVRATAMVFGACIKDYQKTIIESYDAPVKRQAHLNYAYCYINPRARSQQRIKTNIDNDQKGCIFWDIRNKCWDHKKDKASKKLYEEIDLADIERQLLNRYGWKFGVKDMDSLGPLWLKDEKERQKERARKGA